MRGDEKARTEQDWAKREERDEMRSEQNRTARDKEMKGSLRDVVTRRLLGSEVHQVLFQRCNAKSRIDEKGCSLCGSDFVTSRSSFLFTGSRPQPRKLRRDVRLV